MEESKMKGMSDQVINIEKLMKRGDEITITISKDFDGKTKTNFSINGTATRTDNMEWAINDIESQLKYETIPTNNRF